MSKPLLHFLESFSGHWAVNLETKVPRVELYEKRIASSKPSLGFFVLLISSAVIATLGLISNSTAVVIGAMIVAPLMDPILSLAFGLAVRRQADSTIGSHCDLRCCGSGRNRCLAQPDPWNQQRAIGNHRPDVAEPD